MKHPDISSQDFTTKKNDDTIKVSDNTTIKNSSTENSVKLSNSFEAPKSYPYKEQKPKDSFTLNKEYKIGDIFKIPKFKSTIPNEKLERKRLEKLKQMH